MGYLFLAVAIIFEVAGTLSLRMSTTATKKRGRWMLAVAVSYVIAFVGLTLALDAGIPLGVAYGIWTAAGVALTAVLSRVLFKEALTKIMVLGILLIMVGVLLIELGSGLRSVADRSYAGQARSAGGVKDGPPLDGTWIERGRYFAVTTFGSSSCPRTPTSIESSDGGVTIHYETSPASICTADLAPTTHEFSVPPDATGSPLTVTLTFSDWEGTEVVVLD